MHLQIGVLDIEWQFQAIALNGRRKSSGDVEVEHIAKLILLGRSAALNSCGQVACIVPAKAGPTEGAEQVSQSLIAEKIQALIRDLKANVRFGLSRLTR